MEYTLIQKNQAIATYMGGPIFLKQVIIGREEEILLTGPEDLEFHNNWNWLIPVWKKLRKEFLDIDDKISIISLDSALNYDDIKTFYDIVSNYCLKWCIRKNIKL